MLRAKDTIRTLLYSAALICTALAAGVLTARLDDWWFQQIGFWSTPSYNDLFIVDDTGQRRGKPNARYQKWEMNLFGFRGPGGEAARHQGGEYCQSKPTPHDVPQLRES